MFHRFGDEAPSDAEISAWVARVKGIVDAGGQVDWVQIYTTVKAFRRYGSTIQHIGFLEG